MIARIGLAAALIVGAWLPAAAHPHVWVDVASQILFDTEGRMVGIRHHWRFDEFFSAYAVQGLDADGDGVLTREELQPLAQVNVESLHEFDFFTFVSVGDYNAGFAAPQDYWLEHEDGVLTLHFTLPLSRPIKASGPVHVEVFDPEYFVAFELPSKEAMRLADAPDGCELEVHLARELNPLEQAALAAIGPEQRELPPELRELVDGLDNTAVITCP
jgi:ABC-type uncharacterized transport system substrate-binding protein